MNFRRNSIASSLAALLAAAGIPASAQGLSNLVHLRLQRGEAGLVASAVILLPIRRNSCGGNPRCAIAHLARMRPHIVRADGARAVTIPGSRRAIECLQDGRDRPTKRRLVVSAFQHGNDATIRVPVRPVEILPDP